MKLDSTRNLIAQELGSNTVIKSGNLVVVKLTLDRESNLTQEFVQEATNWYTDLLRDQLWPGWSLEETDALIAVPVSGNSRTISIHFRSPAPRDIQKVELDALMDVWLSSQYSAVGQNAFEIPESDAKLH